MAGKGRRKPAEDPVTAEALFTVGLKEEAMGLISTYWGGMIDLGADTFWESYQPETPEYSPYGSTSVLSYCHARSCTPVYLLQRYAPETLEM